MSAGADLGTDWIMAHNEFIRRGMRLGRRLGAGGRGQRAQGQPARSVRTRSSHPGDSYSYDMFSAAGLQVRANPAEVLGGLRPRRLIAAGESQSASRLVTYIDAVHPLGKIFDGYMVHSRSAGGARLTQAPLPDVPVPSPLKIRDDLDVPVMVVQAETDVVGSNLGARQPDTAKFREWEMAGTSHADSYTISVGGSDIGTGTGATQMFALMRNPQAGACTSPVNAGPHHWFLQTAYHDLEAWVRDGTLPPVGTPMQVVSTSPVVLARDAQGNALGGLRSPQVDAPVATLTGQQQRRRLLRPLRQHDAADHGAAHGALPDARELRRQVDDGAVQRGHGRLHPPRPTRRSCSPPPRTRPSRTDRARRPVAPPR